MSGAGAHPQDGANRVARAIQARGRPGDPVVLAVVGPSGVGKDSVMALVARARPAVCLIRRVITRAADDRREAHDRLDPEAFSAAEASGRFALTWRAHGLCYGIPALAVAPDAIALVNLSRTVLQAADAVFPRLGVVELHAPPACLAQRLALRDGGDADAIAERLSRDIPVAFDPARLIPVDNSGPLEIAVAQVLALCDAVRDHAGAA